MIDLKKVILLRAVNVGGIKVLMAPLKDICARLGWIDVRSYIASGNLVGVAEGHNTDLAAAIETELARELGQAPDVLVMSAVEFNAIAQAHPFSPEAGNQSHIYFCWDTPEINSNLLVDVKADDEALVKCGYHLHLLAPSGIGRSKLVAKFEKIVDGTRVTGRNMNTVRKLVSLLDELPAN